MIQKNKIETLIEQGGAPKKGGGTNDGGSAPKKGGGTNDGGGAPKKSDGKTKTPPTTSGCISITTTGQDIMLNGALVKKCMIGDIVSKIQERLKHHGFPNFSKDGSIDKTYGSRTANMVKQFQAKVGLTVDGIVGPKTWAELNKGKTQINPVTPVTPVTPKKDSDFDNMQDYLGPIDFSDTTSTSSGSSTGEAEANF